MLYLYLDNFRGFHEQYIPISKVNFLVGENSTGKSSVLNLLGLMGSAYFLSDRSFDSGQKHFIHHEDIVSRTSSKSRKFSVGIIYADLLTESADDSKAVHAWKFTYKDVDGLPELESFWVICPDRIFKFSYKQIHAECRIYKSPRDASLESLQDCLANRCIEDCSFEHEHTLHLAQGARIPPMFLMTAPPSMYLKDEGREERFPIFQPLLKQELVEFAPIRTTPQRTYDEYQSEFSSQGEHTPYILKRMLNSAKKKKEWNEFLGQVGEETGLFEKINIKTHGKSKIAPFEIDAVLNAVPHNISNVGYGVSQVLPILVEIFSRRSKCGFGIQQPEVHLHPRAQAAIGRVIFSTAITHDKWFVVETHSDYMIDRFRLDMARSDKKCEAQVVYFERSDVGNTAYSLPIDGRGSLPKSQPKGYREFFLREEMQLLGLN